jgi:hypothetical protein
MRCPDCGRRGVYVKLAPYGEDGYKCRYTHFGCEFFAYTGGTMTRDVEKRQRLASCNPGSLSPSDVKGYYGYDD